MNACKSILLATLAVAFAVFGAGWLTMLNGQTFGNALRCLACLTVGACVLLLGYRTHRASRFRSIWLAALCLQVVAGTVIALQLPGAYRFQSFFNANAQKTFETVGNRIGSD